ncbi:MAG: hypothetical protein QXP34_00450 [Candidatus Aenigmatarchaeota archaeon]
MRKKSKNKSKELERKLEEFALKEFYKIIRKIKRNEKNLRYIG